MEVNLKKTEGEENEITDFNFFLLSPRTNEAGKTKISSDWRHRLSTLYAKTVTNTTSSVSFFSFDDISPRR
jgi:hypothetical protein